MTDNFDASQIALCAEAAEAKYPPNWKAAHQYWREQAEKAKARVAELEAAFDEEERKHGITSDGNLWRFWSVKARDLMAQHKAEYEAKAQAAEARALAAEAAALERAAQWHEGEKHRIIAELSDPRFAGNERLYLDAAADHETFADAIRALITPAARTALDAALADARREQSDYVKALEDALRKLELANDRVCGARPQRVYNLMIAAGMSDALIALDDARREAMRALAARVEGGDV